MGLRFAEATWELHSYDVWGCASIVCGGGLSDDGFVYWRRWLVLQGSSLYRSIFKNPDAALADYWQSVGLTELANESVYDYCNGERAQYVFDDYAGGSPPRSKRLEYLMRRRPRGRAWANQAELRQRFPALVRLFGG